MFLNIRRGVLFLSIFFLLEAGFALPARAWEKCLLVLPLRPLNHEAKQISWFGPAFRLAWAQAGLSLDKLSLLKDDELAELRREFNLADGKPEPGLLEHLADEKEIAVLYGSYSKKGRQIVLYCHLVPGRNEEKQSYKISGSLTALRLLFTQNFRQILSGLELNLTRQTWKEIERVPGTDSRHAFRYYSQALTIMRSRSPENRITCPQSLLLLNRAIKADPAFVPALAMRAKCRILAAPVRKKNAYQTALNLAWKELETGMKLEPENPLLQNAAIEYYMARDNYSQARTLAEAGLKSHPVCFHNYLLLGRIYRKLNMPQEAEKVLLQARNQQGTDLQKRDFNLELGILSLKRNDKHAEIYLHKVLQLEPQNARVLYLRATALYRLRRHMEALQEILKAQSIKKWKKLKQLKAKTTLALGRTFFDKGDYNRAYSYASIALNLGFQDFETLLLMAKAMRKLGYHPEARKQLDLARKKVRPDQTQDHLRLGTEYVAQGFHQEGVREYVLYLEINPKAPGRRRLISYIRKLRGESK